MHTTDFAFANDVRAAVELRTPRTARMLLVSSLALLVAAIVWANYAVLDEVKRGAGRVVPSRQIQVVQSLEGGIVGALDVHEGDIVKQDQVLARIDDTKFASELGEVRERRNAMAARVARLEAESKGLPAPDFPAELKEAAPSVVQGELSVFQTRARKLADDLNVLTQQETRLTETLALLSREVELTRKLYDQKIVPEIEWLRLARQSTDMRGQLAEVKARKANATAAFRAQADEDLAKSSGDLAVLQQNITSARDRVRRADLKSPVYGIVNKINVTTIGAVVQPGASLMEIVPLEDTLLVEGRIRPQDIAFIHPGQDAVVKISAYHFERLRLAQGQGRADQRRYDRGREGLEGGEERDVLPHHGAHRDQPPRHSGASAADHSRHGGDRRGADRPQDRARLPHQAGAPPARGSAARAVIGPRPRRGGARLGRDR